jgi:hypothetical protein
MSGLVPEHIKGDVDVNVNINVDAVKIGNAVVDVVWALCFASIARSWFRKR